MKKKFNSFEILIGQDSFRSTPPIMTFIVGEFCSSVRLEDFKNWVNDIWDSMGNRSEKSYEAKKNLDQFFAGIFIPLLNDFKNQENLV